MIREKKKHFFEEKLNENIGKPKELWKTLKSLGLPTKNSSNSTNICLGDKDKLNFEAKSNAEIFKNFFSNLASNLVSKLPQATQRFGMNSVSSYYSKYNLNDGAFTFQKISHNDVYKILKDVNVSKAAGLDDLNGKFLKDGANALSFPIAQLCNLSINLSIFPNCCKIAKLKPLFKKGLRTDPKNYRPISLLPLVSKVIEKVIHNQTQEFLTQKKLLYSLQSGFCKSHSTDSCLSYLTDKILKGFDSGLLTGMILIDLQKAFDTIDHEILLDKMKYPRVFKVYNQMV